MAPNPRGTPRTRVALAAILFGALALRLGLLALLRGKQTHDLRIFVSWAKLLMQYGPHGLYEHVDTIDHYPVNYPPVYALVLTAVVNLYRSIPPAHENDVVLGMLLKLPAIAADLALCALAFVIVRRWAGSGAALGAAAIAAFAPSTWPISAVWGQVDSVCSAFLLFSLALALQGRYVAAWPVLALAILVKPFPIAVVPLLLAAQVRRQGWSPQLLLGPVCAVAVAYVTTLPFAPTPAPPGALHWLAREYALGQSLSHSTSENAYNLWTAAWPPVADTNVLFGVTLHAWGWVACAALIVATTVTFFYRLPLEPGEIAREMLTARAWFIVLCALFLLLTRMHERYILFALALGPLMWYCGRWERWAAATLMVTFMLCVILVLGAYEHSWFPEIPAVTHLLSVLNLAALTALTISFFRPRIVSRSAG